MMKAVETGLFGAHLELCCTSQDFEDSPAQVAAFQVQVLPSKEMGCGVSEEAVDRLSVIWHEYDDTKSSLLDRVGHHPRAVRWTRLTILIILTDLRISSLPGLLV
jgi:hypothetical protein